MIEPLLARTSATSHYVGDHTKLQGVQLGQVALGRRGSLETPQQDRANAGSQKPQSREQWHSPVQEQWSDRVERLPGSLEAAGNLRVKGAIQGNLAPQ